MTSLLSNLREHLQITPLDDDQVQVLFVLPSDLLFDYLHVLDSLTGLVKTVRSKVRLAKYSDSSADSFSTQARDRFYKRVVALYDLYRAQGLKRTIAIQRISSELRVENHPWASVDLVRTALNAAGRPGRLRGLIAGHK